VNELPTPPFPELHALDQKRTVPTMAELLGNAHPPTLPDPGVPRELPATEPSVLRIPGFPAPGQAAPHSTATPAPGPMEDMPVDDPEETMQETVASLMAEGLNAAFPQRNPSNPTEAAPPGHATGSTPPATDDELAEAFRPLVESSLNKSLYSPATGLQHFLEPMLRSTVRRAIAEQMDTSRQFRRIGAFDRLAWRLQALITSRSYEDIIFDRTRRYQVEEAYLLHHATGSLLSYASHDPARHASPRRVQSTIRDLVDRLQAPDGTIEPSFDLPDHRIGLVREGRYCLLIGVLRGRSNALVRADLDYVLRQVEDRFGDRLDTRSEAFVRVLQPLLEGCLLIQSPAPPH